LCSVLIKADVFFFNKKNLATNMSDIIDILNTLRSMNMANQDEDEVVVVVSPEGDDDEDYTWDGEQQPLSASQEVEEVIIHKQFISTLCPNPRLKICW
jgi:hypothetical protein